MPSLNLKRKRINQSPSRLVYIIKGYVSKIYLNSNMKENTRIGYTPLKVEKLGDWATALEENTMKSIVVGFYSPKIGDWLGDWNFIQATGLLILDRGKNLEQE